MKTRQLALAGAALSFLALGSPACATGSAAPGHSVGHVFLGMDRADVWKILGKPKRSTTVPHGMELYGVDDWTGHDDHPTLTVTSLHDKVVQVEFDSTRITTTEGLSTNSTLTKIRRRYPAMTVRAYRVHLPNVDNSLNVSDVFYLDDVPGGIAFTLEKAESIKESLMDPVDTLIIHRPGSAALPIHNGHWFEPGTDFKGLKQLWMWFTPKGGTRK